MVGHTEAAPALQRQGGQDRSPGDQTQLQGIIAEALQRRNYSKRALRAIHKFQCPPPLRQNMAAFLIDRQAAS